MRRTAAIVVALLAAGCLTTATPAAGSVAGCPQVIAHRTAMLTAPENTVPGIQASATSGAGGVEMDVQWSSSSFPILMHDSTVDRTTDGTNTPASLGLSQLTSLWAADYAPWSTDPAYATVKVPYGNEFMSASKNANLDVILDIHAAPSDLGMEKLRIYVSDYHGWTARTLVMANASQVIAMRGWEPGLRYAVIEYPPAGRTYTGEYLVSIGATAYVLPQDRITAPLVAYLHATGLQVYTWTSDSPAMDVAATWDRVTTAGVDAIITNQPAALVAHQAGGC